MLGAFLLLGRLLLLSRLVPLFLFLFLAFRPRGGSLPDDSTRSGTGAGSNGSADCCPNRPTYGHSRGGPRGGATQSARS
jgi:hypothetical protein